MSKETDDLKSINLKPIKQFQLNPPSMSGTLVQISKTHAEEDEICLTIIQEPDIHIRVSLTPQNFTDTLLSGRKVEAKVVRWRISSNKTGVEL